MFIRKNSYWLPLVTVFLLLTLLLPANSTPTEATEMVDVLVTFSQPPGPNEIALIQSLGGTVKKVFTLIPTIAATMPEQNLDALRADPKVEIVEPDTTFSLPPETAPPGMMSLLTGQELPWGVDRIDAELVHPTNKGTGIKVAVLDTGIDLDHPDLNVAGNVTFVPGTTSGDDDHGHGTAVAGIIGALDNEIGVIGVAPEAALYAVKVLDSNAGGAVSVTISGIEWAVNNGMQVINLSMDAGGSMWTSVGGAYWQAIESAYNAGIVVVAGAGNRGTSDGQGDNIPGPAAFKASIAVGNTDEQNTRYTTSSTGPQLEVMAPGTNIHSTAMGGDYGYMTGTSASSPHAAGAAALLIKSGLTNNADVRRRLRDAATDLGTSGWDTQYGKGLINAYNAVNFSQPPDQSAPVTTISLSGTVGNYDWYRSDVQVTISAVDYGGSGVAQIKYSLDTGQTWLDYSGPFYITTEGWSNRVLARAWDSAGNDEGPPDFIYFKMDKTPPVLTETTDPVQVQRINPRGQMFVITYTGTAEDAVSAVNQSSANTTLIDEYGVYNANLGSSFYGSTSVEQWCAGSDQDGRTYTFRFMVSDMAGNQATVEAVTTVVK